MEQEESPQKMKYKDLPGLLLDTGKAWINDDPWRLSAVVAYYAVLSLPALMVIIINVVGAIWGKEIVAGRLSDEISSTLGSNAAEAIKTMVANSQEDDKSLVSSIIGIAVLIFGATGVFYQLQISLNRIWELKADPKSEFKKMLTARLKSFSFILVIGFLLLISFIITAGISVLTDYIKQMFPDIVLYLARTIDFVVSVAIIALLFALMFKFLPDARIKWRTIWPGAIITSLLFVLGKFLLGLYFGEADPGSTYGAAGSIVLILLWVSYSCLILFFGAEFTWVYAQKYGHKVIPTSFAIRVKEQVIELEHGKDLPENKEDGKKKKNR